MNTIYLDNAATSFPKPAGVSDSMKRYMDRIGATINRSVYASAQDAGLVTLQLRQRLGRLFSFSGPPTHVILTPGATAGLNMILSGFLRPGDHCIVSSMEHNAVMRPLLRMEGVEVDRIPCDDKGLVQVDALPGLIRKNTRLVILAHGSNVCGTVQDAQAIGDICARHGIPFALDAAQTAGHYPIDFQRFGLSAMAVPGHKGLLGPSGIGALVLGEEFAGQLTPLIAGGTGSASDSEYLPPYLPDRFESGTPNMPGIYGFEAAVGFVEEQGVDALRAHEMELCGRFLDGLSDLPGLRLCGTRDLRCRVGVLSVDFLNQDNAEAAFRLETEYGILTRCGLHCAPSAHKTLGTFPQGTVRFSLGFANSKEDVDAALAALRELSGA
ncbi:aminotransferase class V-fold PLP-dependent enzyme [Oscillibacter sp. MSJ-2]|uniref:Aminotransferase class V-fold PLP-dependent enzyme n=1 Tax=Dysosmobacter acutus TaxID=2841504 RepID=A0ABS6FAR1_9FIRM|nr:aminotransferase class V-fold PLP-dependent enzyme [Dysosmobacter acutus]MBU5627378.1 aminotransferase class V-fold PLP-dependent enzyme [Dysosmobacter acutus]